MFAHHVFFMRLSPFQDNGRVAETKPHPSQYSAQYSMPHNSSVVYTDNIFEEPTSKKDAGNTVESYVLLRYLQTSNWRQMRAHHTPPPLEESLT